MLTNTTCFDGKLFSSGSKFAGGHVGPRQVELRHLAVERAVADEHDEHDVVFLGGLRDRREGALDFLLRRLAGRALRILLGLLGEIDDVVASESRAAPSAPSTSVAAHR